MLLGPVEEGVRLFEDAIRKQADHLAQELGVTLTLDPDVVREVYAAASASITTHNIPLEKISDRKEAAHLAFWTAELKPVSVKSPLSPSEFIDRAQHFFQDRVHGPHAIMQRASELYGSAKASYVKNSIFPVSEYVAMSFIRTGMESVFREQTSKDIDQGLLKMYKERNEYFRSILTHSVFNAIVQGLRFHIFTPRSFATLIESVFALEGMPYVAH